MNIIYSPEYSGTVFLKPDEDSNVLMDVTVVNTIGLVSLLELRLGLHYEDLQPHEREALYFDAVSQYMKATPKNVLAASFKISGLSTSEAILAWRDELRMAGWDFYGAEISNRLAVIVGVEEYFRKSLKTLPGVNGGCDLAGRLHIVTDQIAVQKLDCKNVTITLPCSIDYLRPFEKELIKAIENQGATVTLLQQAAASSNNLSAVRALLASNENKQIQLSSSNEDKSFLIWRFPDEKAANEYLSYKNLEDTDVWINASNKEMDDWLRLMSKPSTGSTMDDCSPQLTQMFIMGIGMFGNPLNVKTLVEWLNMPLHPMGKYFREKLAEAIASEGGYRNETCKTLIAKYIKGDFVYLNEEQRKLPEEEQQKLREEDTKKRKQQVACYLPSMTKTDALKTETLRTFASSLAAWCRNYNHQLKEKGGNALWIEQLSSVASMADAFCILLNSVETETVDEKVVDSWVSTIYQKASFTNAVAEKGCRTVVGSPAKLISTSHKTIWMGVEGDQGQHLECSFLYPSEKEALTENKYITGWAQDMERKYHESMLLTPFRMTDGQLILVICDRRGGEATQKHPLVVRLEQQISNLDVVTVYPQIPNEELSIISKITNTKADCEIEFEHADLLQWPDHLSPTSIDTLVEYPLDYLLEQLLHIEADSKAQMSNVRATMGNVAHEVIERLFKPRDEARYSKPQDIEQRIKSEFEDVFTETLEAKGAILLLAENKLKGKLLHEQLKECLKVLLEILKDNDLKVTGCERFVKDFMDLGLPTAVDKDGNEVKRDVLGFIDMTLEDNTGRPIVFDFKWTSSRKYYQGLLSDNRSIQLEMYRRMLAGETRDQVERVGYFLMPEARLYSKEAFKGPHCQQLEPANNDNIVEQLRNAILYRKQQLDSGIVEANGEFGLLKYNQDAEEKNLYPLKESDDTGMKEPNGFSNFDLF